MKPETKNKLPSSGKSLTAGIVGAGLMGRWHAHAIKRSGASLAAVVDVELTAAQKLAGKFGGARSYSSMEQLLKHKQIDVLHLCTPLDTHYHFAEQAIEAGLHLIIEKPLTSSAKETEKLYKMAEKHGVLICPVHQFIFQDGFLNAKKQLQKIGRIVHVAGIVCSAGGTNLPEQRLDEIVADILPHPLSIMQALLPDGLPKENWITTRPAFGELRASCEMSGNSLSVLISMNSRPTICSFKIMGTEGTIHLDLFHGYSFVEPGKVSRTQKIIRPFELAGRRLIAATFNLGKRTLRNEMAYPGLNNLISSFYAAVKSNGKSPVSGEDCIAIARVREELINA